MSVDIRVDRKRPGGWGERAILKKEEDFPRSQRQTQVLTGGERENSLIIISRIGYIEHYIINLLQSKILNQFTY